MEIPVIASETGTLILPLFIASSIAAILFFVGLYYSLRIKKHQRTSLIATVLFAVVAVTTCILLITAVNTENHDLEGQSQSQLQQVRKRYRLYDLSTSDKPLCTSQTSTKKPEDRNAYWYDTNRSGKLTTIRINNTCRIELIDHNGTAIPPFPIG